MENLDTALTLIGAVCFGIVLGWITYGTLRRLERRALTDLTSIVGVLGGAAVTALFPSRSATFGAYCIGLAIGFFAYLKRATNPGAPDWLGERPAAPTRQGSNQLEDIVPD
jgi:NhaP-type Na+/H+ or K+/H+ antiporter